MLKIFKSGETIDLAIPTEKFALKSNGIHGLIDQILQNIFYGVKKILQNYRLNFFESR